MHLERLKIGFVRIDGDTPLSRRQGILDGFAADKDSRILLMTTGTGAYGSVSTDSI
jgi:SWI/SNF-related matrix-associated actin-dependent regulator of chromatin subfamily A3